MLVEKCVCAKIVQEKLFFLSVVWSYFYFFCFLPSKVLSMVESIFSSKIMKKENHVRYKWNSDTNDLTHFNFYYKINSIYLGLHYANQELPDVQAGFSKGRGTRDQIANILLHYRERKVTSEKHLSLFHWLCLNLWLCRSWQTVESS